MATLRDAVIGSTVKVKKLHGDGAVLLFTAVQILI